MKTAKSSFNVMLAILIMLCSVIIVASTANAAITEKESTGTQSKSGNFAGGYSLSGSAAAAMVSIANAQLNRTQSQFGYTEAWCADFVSDCAKIAGQSSAIPFNGVVSSSYSAVIGAGGSVVASPQAGDLVYYKVSGTFAHVGIMVDSTYMTSGNMWTSGYSKVEKIRYTSYKYGSYQSAIFVRPNYRGTHTHNYNTFVEYQAAHPHYALYKCNGCTATQVNKNATKVLSSCAQCVSSYKATLTCDKSYYNEGDAVTISWNKITNATHYNLWLYRYNDDGSSSRVSRDDLIKGTSFKYSNLAVGRYYTLFNTYDSKVWMVDGSDWFHSEADKLEFNIVKRENLGYQFYATITRTSDGMAFTEKNKNIALYSYNKNQNQVWKFVRQNDGAYMIYNVATGNYIDLDCSRTANGTNIKGYQKNEVNAQHWFLAKKGNGYNLLSKCKTDSVIDAWNNASDEGTNLQLYNTNSTAAQIFSINKVDSLVYRENGGSLYTDDVKIIHVDNINGGRGDSQCVVYTSGAGSTTPTNIYGKEISFNANGQYVGFREYGSETKLAIPIGGFVISEHLGSKTHAYINQIKGVYKYAYVNYEYNDVVLFKNASDYKIGLRKFIGVGEKFGELPTPTRKGYNFDGWYTSSSGGTKITSTSVYNGTSSIYARWVEKTNNSDYVSEAPVQQITVKKINTINVITQPKSVKKSKLKNTNVTVKAITVSNAKGDVSYSKIASGSSKYLTVNKNSGKITIKKGKYKKNTVLKINVKVTAKGNSSYKACSITVAVKIKVK